ncbi:unnamed protein product [Didymodactylos carnosus]|uniref:Uncharacterized protein n=1 Tax=Didymodactylos carnosus TaxID=1234261 RepID=A0A813WFX0_9BILA|nr:unnamed protein product [Didymodactylos carnosus]CAF3643108.1 unnamed protein product [Didymodactylos carnosus]
MLDTGVSASVQIANDSTPRPRWPRKWTTLGGRATISNVVYDPSNFDELSNGHSYSKTNGNGKVNGSAPFTSQHHPSLWRKASTISRTTTNDKDQKVNGNGIDDHLGSGTSSLKKSRSLMNVLRSKLNSPAVLRRFRTKSRESVKYTIQHLPHQQQHDGNDFDYTDHVAPTKEDNNNTTDRSKQQQQQQRLLINEIKQKSSSLPKSKCTSSYATTGTGKKKKPSLPTADDPPNNNGNEKPQHKTRERSRIRDPSPMRRFANRIVQITTGKQSSENNHNKEKKDKDKRKSVSPSAKSSCSTTTKSIDGSREGTIEKGHVDNNHKQASTSEVIENINARYDEIRARYGISANAKRIATTSIAINDHPYASPRKDDVDKLSPAQRLKEILGQEPPMNDLDTIFNPSSLLSDISEPLDKINKQNSKILNDTDSLVVNRSLSTISMNGSMRSTMTIDNSFHPQYTKLILTDTDPLSVARKQSNIKLNCMLSGYGFQNPFSQQNKDHDLFKFHHYHDVGTIKYDFGNRDSLRKTMFTRIRPLSRSIDSVKNIQEQQNMLPTTITQVNKDYEQKESETIDHYQLPIETLHSVESNVDTIYKNENACLDLDDDVENVTLLNIPLKSNSQHDVYRLAFEDEKSDEILNELKIVEPDFDQSVEENNKNNVIREVAEIINNIMSDSEENNSPTASNKIKVTCHIGTESSDKNLPIVNQPTVKVTSYVNNNRSNDSDKQQSPSPVVSSPTSSNYDELMLNFQNLNITETNHHQENYDNNVDDIDKNLAEAVERALTVARDFSIETQQDNDNENIMNRSLIEMTERAISSTMKLNMNDDFEDPSSHYEVPNNNELLSNVNNNDQINSNFNRQIESPTVELVDRTGEIFEDGFYKSSPLYHSQSLTDTDQQQFSTNSAVIACEGWENKDAMVGPTCENLWSFVDEITRKTKELIENDESRTADLPPSINQNGKHHYENEDNNYLQNSEENFVDEHFRDAILSQVDENYHISQHDNKTKDGRTLLSLLDQAEKVLKDKVSIYNKVIDEDNNRNYILVAIGEANLLFRGKLKQFRDLCNQNLTKKTPGEPIPLDSDLEGFWEITYPLIDKCKLKFDHINERRSKNWIQVEKEIDPNDVNCRPRVHLDAKIKSKIPAKKTSTTTDNKSARLRQMIEEKRRLASIEHSATNGNSTDMIQIFTSKQ